MEEVGQLVIAIIFILFYALAGSKRKKKNVPPAARRRQPQAPMPAPSPSGADDATNVEAEREALDSLDERQLAGTADELRDQQGKRKRSLAEELFAMLEGQEPSKSGTTLEMPEVDDEAQSLEVIESSEFEIREELRRDIDLEKPAPSVYPSVDMPRQRPYAVDDAREVRPYLVEDLVEPEPYAIQESRKRKKYLTRSELRHAFVMRELLGPPKALEE